MSISLSTSMSYAARHISMLYVNAACLLLHVHVAFPCCWLIMHVLFACHSDTNSHASCSCSMSMIHVHVSMLLILAASLCCLSMLRVHAVCSSDKLMLLVHAASPCYMSMFHVHLSMLLFHTAFSVLHVHAACPCCIPMLHSALHVHAAWPCLMPMSSYGMSICMNMPYSQRFLTVIFVNVWVCFSEFAKLFLYVILLQAKFGLDFVFRETDIKISRPP